MNNAPIVYLSKLARRIVAPAGRPAATGSIVFLIVAALLVAVWPAEVGAAPPVLTILEYPVAGEGTALPDEFTVWDQLPPEVGAKHTSWQEWAATQIESANRQLAPFGYRFVRNPGNWEDRADLMRGNQVVIANSQPPGRIAVNASGTDFAMVLENTPNVRPFELLVRKAGTQPWDVETHAYHTDVAFLGDDLLTLDTDSIPEVPNPIPFQIRSNGRAIYEGMSPPILVDNPMKGLWAWQGHWAFEVAEQVILDGQSLGAQRGYDKVYGFRLLKGQPFFFFERGGIVQVSYADVELDAAYDEVAHYKCCSAGMFNPQGNEDMVWYWARHDGAWWYVEAGVYD